MGVRSRAARSRELIAKGRRPAVVARVLQVNRSGLYRKPKRRPVSVRGPVVDPVDRLIVDVTLRCRTDEAITLVEQAIATQDIEAGSLTLGTDNGSAFTSRRFKTTLTELGVTHRRGGYRDPESQAFIESWFGRLNSDSSGAAEFDTLDDARAAIGGYVDSYHHRPHSGLRYRTPTQVRQTWKDGQRLLKTAA